MMQLGATGLSVSAIGFGGIPIIRLSFAEAIDVVRRAVDQGITFFDTANRYVDSEEKMGRSSRAFAIRWSSPPAMSPGSAHHLRHDAPGGAKRMSPAKAVAFSGETMETVRQYIECRECETRCPYNLPIADMLQEHLALYDSHRQGN